MVRDVTLGRREVLKLAAVLGGAAIVGMPRVRAKPATATLRVGFVPIACAAPLLAADALGAFAAQGIEVKLRKFAGWADLWTAYATGELDAAHMLSPMPIACDAGLTRGARPTQLVFTQNTNGQALTLGAKHHPHVHDARDLRGMVLGIPFEFSVHNLLLRDYLTAHGVDPTSDLELRLLRPPDMVAQLSVGTIDGFIGPEPFNQRALKTGAGRIFVPTREMWEGHPCCSVAMAKDVPESVRSRVVAALKEGATAVNSPQHLPEVSAEIAKERYLNQAPALLEEALKGSYLSWSGEQITDPDMINFGGATQEAAVTWLAAQLARWQLGVKPLALNDATIIAAARAVLPPDAEPSRGPLLINGRSFDPARPTATLLGESS